MKHTIATILDDRQCMKCGYNLRGLSGKFIECPECGQVDNTSLPQWTGDWFDAPEYLTVALPVVWFIIAGPFCAHSIHHLVHFPDESNALMVLLYVAAGVSGWVWLFQRGARSFNHPLGVSYVLLMHVALTGFILAILSAPLITGAWVIWMIQSSDFVSGSVFMVLCLAVDSAVGLMCIRLQRYVGRKCVMAHVRQRVMEDAVADAENE